MNTSLLLPTSTWPPPKVYDEMNPVFTQPLLSHSLRRVDTENSQSSRIYLVRSSTFDQLLKTVLCRAVKNNSYFGH